MKTLFQVAIVVCGCFGWAELGDCESPSLTGLDPRLPIVEGAPRRAVEDDANQLDRSQRGPIAELMDQFTKPEAIIEVLVGQGRVLSTKQPIAEDGGVALVAVGDPTVLDFAVAGPQLLRIVGNRVGVTDLTLTTQTGETYSFEVHVVYDIPLLQAYLQQVFPDATIRLQQLREHVVLSGQARSPQQVEQIAQTLNAYLISSQAEREISGKQSDDPETVDGSGGGGEGDRGQGEGDAETPDRGGERPPSLAPIERPETRPEISGSFYAPRVINLMRVPSERQVMLQVKVAELNRTALRQIGADIFYQDGDGNTLGTQIGGSVASIFGLDISNSTTAFSIFPNASIDFFMSALRRNSIINILAEPTLVTLDGQEATFLAGGEFPVPVPQTTGVANTITIEFREFGVLLNFVPHVQDDESIRLRVAPEVSSIDETLGIVLSGASVPGLSSRKVNTTVELREGQTLALAGLLQVELDAQTDRIPGLGDVPYLGPMFSNTRHQRVEKELIVLVTPHLVAPMQPGQVPDAPGAEIMDPNDLEFYLLNRIEGRTGTPFRATTAWDDPLGFRCLMELEKRYACGPVGYSE